MLEKIGLEKSLKWISTNKGNSIVGILGIVITIMATAISLCPQYTGMIMIIIVLIGISLWLALRKKLNRYSQHSQTQSPKPPPKNSPCPYITGHAVTAPNFVGRRSELQQLAQYLHSGESMALLGDRRIGKSSLLQTWTVVLQKNQQPVFLLNGQNREGENLASFLSVLLQREFAAPLSADQAADYLVIWAKQQRSETGKKPVILVDECEAILHQCPHRFWERVRGALPHIIWVFSTKKPIDLLYTEQHSEGSPFENQLKTVWLGLLTASAATQLIRRGQFSSQQEQLLVHWAGCHPFYLQALATQLWHRSSDTSPQAALDAFKMEAERHLKDLWQSLNHHNQSLLRHHLISSQAIDNSALRSHGIITAEGELFAQILRHYLSQQEHR